MLTIIITRRWISTDGRVMIACGLTAVCAASSGLVSFCLEYKLTALEGFLATIALDKPAFPHTLRTTTLYSTIATNRPHKHKLSLHCRHHECHHLVPGVITFAMQVMTMPAPSTLSEEDGEVYGLRCNSAELPEVERIGTINWIRYLGRQTETVTVAEKGEPLPKCPGEDCPRVYVSLRIWDPQGTGISKVKVKLSQVADGLQQLSDHCGDKGGSMQVPGTDDLIVHMTDDYV